MKVLPSGIAILESDTHLSRFVEEHNRLDHDGTFRKSVIPLIGTGDCVMDVGAAIGDGVAALAPKVGPRGWVVAVEPNPKMFECLAHNTERWPWVQRQHVALGAEVNNHRLVENDNAGMGYLEECADGLIQSVTMDFVMDFVPPQHQHLHFLKIDVEGMELAVLQGGRETIKRCRPIILIEMNADALGRYGETVESLSSLLRGLRYRIEPLVPENYDPKMFDALCFPD